MNGKYTIQIKVIDEHENQVYKTEVNGVDWIAPNIRIIEREIKKYDEEHYKECHQCKEYFNIDDMTIPEETEDVFICDICIEKIMSGEEKLNSPDTI